MIFKEHNRRKWIALVYLVIFFLLEILIVSNNSFINTIDTSAQNILNTITTPINTKIFTTITFIGSPIMDAIYLIIMMLLLYRIDKIDASLWIAIIGIGGNIISYLIKISVKRSRPTNKIIPASGYSFPSGHVFGTMLVILTIIILVLPLLNNLTARHVITAILIIWLIIVALSRVYLRGHYFSDVTGSMLLAGAWWEYSEMLYFKYYSLLDNFLNLNNQDK